MRKLNLLSARRLLPFRPDNSHKGTYGRTLIVAGSENMTGACILATRSCFKTGVGLVEVSITEKAKAVIQASVPEAILLPYDKLFDDDLSRFDAILIGPGLSQTEESIEVLRYVLTNAPTRIPLVLDADALNLMSKFEGISEIVKSRAETVITPHPGEAARLLGKEPSEIVKMGSQAAFELANRFYCTCVLKIYPEVIATKEGELWVNATGNNGMATAGSGDVLAGMIAGFLTQKVKADKATLLGCYFYGNAGDRAARKMGKAAVTASDIVSFIKLK